MRLSILILTCTLLSCTQYSDDAVINPNWKVLGHGGAGFDVTNAQHPPNSMRSIKQGLFYYEADGVEVDLQVSKDGVLFLYHDERLETATNGHGLIEEEYASSIKEYAYRKSFGPEIVPIAEASELVDLLKDIERNVIVSFQFSQTEMTTTKQNLLIKAFINLVKQVPTRHQVLVESENLNVLMKVKEQDSTVNSFLIFDHIDLNHIKTVEKKVDGYSSYFGAISEEKVKQCNSNGLEVMVYGVKIRKDIIDILNWPIGYVQLDNLMLIQ